MQAVILAAGKSKRFNTGKTKQLATICGQPMIFYPIKALEKLEIPITVIVGKDSQELTSAIKSANFKNISFAIQEEQLGTAHAVLCSKNSWSKENILIINGDMPLITSDLLESLYRKHSEENLTLSFFTSYVLDPRGYGRIIDHEGRITVIEEKECTEENYNVNCINAGVYLVKKDFLEECLSKISSSKTTGEFYLPDIIRLASEQKLPLKKISVPYDNVRGVNTLKDLWMVEQIKRSELIDYWMSQGVRFELAQNIHIDIDVEIGRGSFIGTGVHLLAGTKVGANCFIGAFSIIEGTTIDNDSTIHSHSVIQDSKIGKNAHVGPFARLRNNVVLHDNVTIGNFVEVKKSEIGENTKAKHLSYLGDATLGSNVNIGAGTITCNHDGVNKHQTIVENDAYIGSNNTLIAPVVVGSGSYTAAGSTINQNVPAGDLAIARSIQVNKAGYAQRLRQTKRDKKDKAALSSDEKKDENNFLKNCFIGAMKVKDISEDQL